MGEVRANGVRLHYVETGSGPETVVLSHSYLVDHRQFEPQIKVLSERFRVIAFDHRDHGSSERVEHSYGMYDLVDDASALLDELGVAPCHWIGLSTGGFVGMRLAIRRPGLFHSMTLMDTAAGTEPLHLRIKYRCMFAVLRTLGIKPVLSGGMNAMFSREFLRDPSQAADAELWRERIAGNDPKALIRFGNAIFGRDDVHAELAAVSIPTLVMVGEQDRAISPARVRTLAGAIPGARFETIAQAGHLSTIEQPQAVNDVLSSFFAEHAGVA